jgi:CRP-like cAMP-binding protein
VTFPTKRSESDLDGVSPFSRKLGRLANLSSEDAAALEGAIASTRTIEQGADLAGSSHPSKGMLVMLDGYGCRYILRDDGSRQITSYLIPGDHCDRNSALDTPRLMSTLSTCRIAFIPRSVLDALSRSSASIAEALSMAAVVEDATLREWLMSVGRRTAEERLAHLFCELLTRFNAVGLADDDSFRFPLTQFDLGDTMGLSYVHVNRTLQSLRQQQFITLRSKVLTVLDFARLSALAEFRPDYLGPTSA